jgi:hypothetical protein
MALGQADFTAMGTIQQQHLAIIDDDTTGCHILNSFHRRKNSPHHIAKCLPEFFQD